MSNFVWYLTPKRKAILEKLEELPEAGKKPKSELIEIALEKYIFDHADANNPQTQVTQFTKNDLPAVPTIMEERSAWENFYKLVKSEKDYESLDEHLNMILELHNKKLRRI